MTRISNYEDLKLEKARLHNNLLSQKAELRHQILVVKDRVEPLLNVISFLGIFKKKENDSLLKMGIKTGVELLAHTTMLSKAGWVSKLVIPFVLKGISSTVVDKIKNRRFLKAF